MYVMFLDESGDHSLDKIDPEYPVFVLAGCILDQKEHDGPVATALAEYKRSLFGRDDLVLHTADIVRNRNGFERLKDRIFRERFYAATNALRRAMDFTVVACAIRKQKHVERYGRVAFDPYALSLECLLERFVFFLEERGSTGKIVAESRNPTYDKDLDLVFQLLLTRGTRYLRPSRVRRSVRGLEFRLKRENVPDLQLADLVATPIARRVLGKTIEEDYRVVEEKFRRRRGTYWGAGLVVLPRVQ